MDNQKQFFEEIIEQHKGILFKVAKTYCRNDDDRQDLIQEMMIQIWKSLHRYNNQFAITTWLYRVSLNVAISFYRKNNAKQNLRMPLIDEILPIQNSLAGEKEEQLELLEKFIAELNDLDRALMLLYLEDKSHAEISEIMGISVTNVGTKLGRIKEKLKKKFSQLNK
ncbi:MAG: RNA polymerase sigma factor [Ignavibacterium sp.]|jgi:RNA polymerase sigma-70 factor (ECF subfamily)|nr:RNA polymerase sigma factor [Ignavibacterium sp.]